MRKSLRLLRAKDPNLESLSDQAATALHYDWEGLFSREHQLPPEGDWRIWVILAGRGFGKTRAGAEWVRGEAEKGLSRRIAIVGRTAADVRDVMVEGETGVLNISPPWFKPLWEPSRRRLTWPNGVVATTFSAEDPDVLRGPQHHIAWCDELASWRYTDAWDMLLLGLRLGTNPRAVVTTTGKPRLFFTKLLENDDTVITRGTTYDNRDNLAPAFFTQIIRRYEGTSQGRQELLGEILTEMPGALLTREDFERTRREGPKEWRRGVVAIDPAVTSTELSDETGIVVVVRGYDDEGYTLVDASGRYKPEQWARRAVDLWRYLNLDLIVAERNNGGEMVRHTIQMVDRNAPVKLVHASQGKRTRAEPIQALYQQGRAHHAQMFTDLEDQWCTWDPLSAGRSPDRLDAEVWAYHELFITGGVQWEDLYPAPPPEAAHAEGTAT